MATCCRVLDTYCKSLSFGVALVVSHLQEAWLWGWKDEREHALPIRKGHGEKGQAIALPPWPPPQATQGHGLTFVQGCISLLGTEPGVKKVLSKGLLNEQMVGN